MFAQTDDAVVSEDTESEETEDSAFWEGVTKPGNAKAAASQENEVLTFILEVNLKMTGVLCDE